MTDSYISYKDGNFERKNKTCESENDDDSAIPLTNGVA